MVEAEWSTGQVVTPADCGLMEAEGAPLFSWILPWGTESKSTRPQQDGEGQPGIMLDCFLLCFCPELGKHSLYAREGHAQSQSLPGSSGTWPGLAADRFVF